jgi:hypothetical protein
MGRDRVDLGFGDVSDDLDLSDFKPRQAPVARPLSGETSRAAEAAGFRSREPKVAESSGRGQRRRRRSADAEQVGTPSLTSRRARRRSRPIARWLTKWAGDLGRPWRRQSSS